MRRNIETRDAASRLGAMTICAAVLLAVTASPLYADPRGFFENGPFIHVECDGGGNHLQRTLDLADDGATIFITGTCDDGPYSIFGQSLQIFASGIGGSDRVTLSAPNSAVPVLGIDHSFVLFQGNNRGFTIDAHGNADGIHVGDGSTVLLGDVVVEGATHHGLQVDGASFARIGGSAFRDNHTGILATRSSSIHVIDTTIENNNIYGIRVTENSSGFIENDSLIDGNGHGVSVGSNASFGIGGSTITNNTNSGVTADLMSVVNFGVSTIEDNGTDVACTNGSAVRAGAPQMSATGTTNLDPDCLVIGTIF